MEFFITPWRYKAKGVEPASNNCAVEGVEMNQFWMDWLLNSFYLVSCFASLYRKVFWSTWKASLKRFNFSLPKLLSGSSAPKWKIHSMFMRRWLGMEQRCWAWLTLWGFNVDDHVRDELWAAGVAVARGHPLCLHLLAFCEQRSLHPSLCNFCFVQICSPGHNWSICPASKAIV